MILIHQRCMKTQDHWDMWCNEPITLTACCFAAESLRRLPLALCFFLHTVLFFALNIFASWLDSSDRRSGCQTLNMLAKNQLSLSLSTLVHPNGNPTKWHRVCGAINHKRRRDDNIHAVWIIFHHAFCLFFPPQTAADVEKKNFLCPNWSRGFLIRHQALFAN